MRAQARLRQHALAAGAIDDLRDFPLIADDDAENDVRGNGKARDNCQGNHVRQSERGIACREFKSGQKHKTGQSVADGTLSDASLSPERLNTKLRYNISKDRIRAAT